MKKPRGYTKAFNLIESYKIDRNKLYHSGRGYVRMLVRIRDNFTCRDCGAIRTPEMVSEHNAKKKGLRGRIKLHDVHHIHGMCGKKSRGIDSIQNMPGLITLCHKCHYNRPEHRVHSKHFASKRTKATKDLLNEIKSVKNTGLSFKELAKKYKLSYTALINIKNNINYYSKLLDIK